MTRDDVVELVERTRSTWRFAEVKSELVAAISAIQNDGSLTDLSKRPLINILNVSANALEERSRSSDHLAQTLSQVSSRLDDLTADEAQQLAAWFFHVAYSGGAITPAIEQVAKPVLARVQGDAAANGRKLSVALDKYTRLAEWGANLNLSEQNLRGLIAASKVLALPSRLPDQLKARAEKAIEGLNSRRALTQAELVRDSVAKCRGLISPVWSQYSRGQQAYLPQNDTVALHICLSELLAAVSDTEGLADVADELKDEINVLRSRFQQVRYPSSTSLLIRAKGEIDELAQRVARSIDFDEMRRLLKDLQARLHQSKRGTKGVNWMHETHVAEALSMTSEVYERIRSRSQSTEALDAELKSVEASVSELQTADRSPTAGQLKRLLATVKKDSLLAAWINSCLRSSEDRRKTNERLIATRERLRELWERMESEQEQRLAQFRANCAEVADHLQESIELRDVLSEILELSRSRDDFTRDKQAEINQILDGLFAKFKDRVRDTPALRQLLGTIHQDVERHHKKIQAFIDFDDLQRRIASAKRWVSLKDFPSADRSAMLAAISRCVTEIRKLRFRQEREKAARQARTDRIAAELQEDLDEASKDASLRPGSHETWQSLVELDSRLRESWHALTEQQRRSLRQGIDAAFQQIRSARAAFADEATRVFSHYNEILSDTLFALEEEPSRERAFEAIEQIKPVRSELRTERRLLKVQRQELIGLLSAISASIDEVFEKASAAATQEQNQILADFDRFQDQIRTADSWKLANELIATHKQLSAQVRDSQLSIAARRSCRAELDRLWDDVAERLRSLRSSRGQTEDLETIFAGLERRGHLQIVDGVPTIG